MERTQQMTARLTCLEYNETIYDRWSGRIRTSRVLGVFHPCAIYNSCNTAIPHKPSGYPLFPREQPFFAWAGSTSSAAGSTVSTAMGFGKGGETDDARAGRGRPEDLCRCGGSWRSPRLPVYFLVMPIKRRTESRPLSLTLLLTPFIFSSLRLRVRDRMFLEGVFCCGNPSVFSL